jgi:hypothetical protein
MEVTLSLIILLAMIVIFAACFPLAVRTATFSNNYSQAAFLVQHKIDEIKSAGFSKLDYNDLNSLGLIDASSPCTPGPNSPCTYYFTQADSLTGFFPTGTTGTITIVSDPNEPLCAAASTCTVDDITVAINATGGGLENQTFSASTMIIKMVHE